MSEVLPQTSPEVAKQSELDQKKLEQQGFHGLEQLKNQESLKEGTGFRAFLDKALAYRSNPEAMKKIGEDLSKLDQAKDRSGLRSGGVESAVEGAARLFALIAKDVEFGPKGITLKLDFGKLVNAEMRFVGAGDFLDASVQKVFFKAGKKDIEGLRTAGREYRAGSGNYLESYSGTEIFIPYDGIQNLDARASRDKAEQERKYVEGRDNSVVQTRDALRALAPGLNAPDSLNDPVPARPHSNEIYRPSQAVVLGDSQVEGSFSALSKKGIEAHGFHGKGLKWMESWIRKNPNVIADKSLVYIQAVGNSFWGSSFEELKADTESLVRAVRRINPSARLVLGTIPPRDEFIEKKFSGKAADTLHERYKAYNDWVSSTFETFDMGRVLAVAPGSGKQRDEFRRNGTDVHFRKEGYQAVVDTFAREYLSI